MRFSSPVFDACSAIFAAFVVKRSFTLRVVETKSDAQNEQPCFSVFEIHFGGISGTENAVKALHLTRLKKMVSPLDVELPKLVDLFENSIDCNSDDTLIGWLRVEMKTTNVDSAHKKRFSCGYGPVY